MATVDSDPQKILTLVNWGWAFVPTENGSGIIVLGSPDGLEQIRFPMNQQSVRGMRQEMMGIDIVKAAPLDG